MPDVPIPLQGASGDEEEAQELPLRDQATVEEQPPPATSPETELPPEAQGEVNGGPLGCCLGVTIGLLLSLTVAILSRLYADPLAQVLHGGLSVTVRIVMFFLAVAGAVIFGYFGWKIGKHLYREYELSPRQQQRLTRLQQRQQQKSARLQQRQLQRQARRH